MRASGPATDGRRVAGPPAVARIHLRDLSLALASLRAQSGVVCRWGDELARRLPAGARLLVAGNGGSAAQALHLTGELVGRYHEDRAPLAAIALVTDVATLTAVTNDYGADAAFARQVRAHGRPGDVLLLLSTSGASPNVVAAAREARSTGLDVWALCGRPPAPVAALATEVVAVEGPTTASVQEAHQVALHLLCRALDRALGLEA